MHTYVCNQLYDNIMVSVFKDIPAIKSCSLFEAILLKRQTVFVPGSNRVEYVCTVQRLLAIICTW